MTLEALLAAAENETREFKKAENGFEFDELVKYLCAFSNRGGGEVVFGVSDRRPRQVVGSRAFEQPERTCNSLIERLHVNVTFEILMRDGLRVLVFRVAARPRGVPVQADGRFWWREGDSLVPMPTEVLRKVYAETGHDFSADICPGATLADLDGRAIAEYRKRWSAKTGNNRLQALTDAQLLQDSEAIVDGGVTYAALALFGRHESLGRLLANAETVFEYRSTEAAGPAQQREEFREGFFLYSDRIWDLVNFRNDKQHVQDGFFIFDVPTFNERAVREAVLNAVCHRNYELPGSVFVRQYRDRIVIESPGAFLPDITPENILDCQAPRNRRIAEILARSGLVERSGQGMNLIYEQCVREAKELPDFSGTNAFQVRITLNGTMLNPGLVNFVRKIDEEKQVGLSTDDFIVLSRLSGGQPLNVALRKRAARLVESGILEKVGREYVLSRRFYQAIGRPGEYTRRVGLGKEASQTLLVNFIAGQSPEGARLKDMQDVLPGIPSRHIQYLLNQLRGTGRLIRQGHGVSARWFLPDPKRNNVRDLNKG